MENFVYRATDYQLKNGLDSTSYGTEFEFKTPIYDRTTLQANYSYIHSENSEHQQTPMIANHLANLMLTYQIAKNWDTGTHIRYVGERGREESDTREPLKAYTSFDQTLTYTIKEIQLQASVKNLFNEDIIFPAPIGNGVSSGTYEDDLHRNGRVFWFSAQWNFR